MTLFLVYLENLGEKSVLLNGLFDFFYFLFNSVLIIKGGSWVGFAGQKGRVQAGVSEILLVHADLREEVRVVVVICH